MACFGPLRFTPKNNSAREFCVLLFAGLGDATAASVYILAACAFFAMGGDGAVGDYSPCSWLAGFLNCAFWVFYGVPASSIPVMVLNSFGALVMLANVGMFLHHVADVDMRDKVCITLVFETIFTSVVAAVIFAFVPQERMSTAFGWIGVGTAVAMYAYPISSMVRVYQTGNAQLLNIKMAMAPFGNAVVWTVYAFLARDRFAVVPNVVGVVIGLLQMCEYVHFTYINPPDQDQEQ